MDDSGNIRFFEENEKIPEKFVPINNGDLLKHTTHERFFLIISVSETELRCRPIANSYAEELMAKRKLKDLEEKIQSRG